MSNEWMTEALRAAMHAKDWAAAAALMDYLEREEEK
jgi:hypothetical protein